MKSLKQLQTLVRRYTDSRQAPLYRNLYGAAHQPHREIASHEEWETLPFLTKAKLLETPIADRTFVPHSEIDAYYHSSGTSGKPPLFTPRIFIGAMDFREKLFTFTRAALSSIGYQHRVEAFMRSVGLPPQVVAIDAKRLDITVQLAVELDVESIFTHTFLIQQIGDKLRALGHAGRINYIELTGEMCSVPLYESIRNCFPAAMVVLSYGLTEIEDPCVGTVCEPSTDEKLLDTLHERGIDEHHLEIIDPDSGALLPWDEGTEGELVVTSDATGSPAFPLLRYRTGDIAQVNAWCEKHGKWGFKVRGRASMDFLRVPGGVFRVDELRRALKAIVAPVDDFELHVATHGKTQATIHVVSKAPLDLAQFAQTLSRELHVGATSTYAQAVERGDFLPLCAENMHERPVGKKKHLVKDS